MYTDYESSSSSDSEDSFEDYVVTTTDPGRWLLPIVVVISVLLYAILPCLVECCKKRKARLEKEKEEAKKEEAKNVVPEPGITTVPDPWKHSFHNLEEDVQLMASNCLGCHAFECLVSRHMIRIISGSSAISQPNLSFCRSYFN